MAGGLAHRGAGRIACVDPHLAGPTWLGLRPDRGTASKFFEVTNAVGVSEWIAPRMGDSAAVAAVWPAEPIDALFIDGDHSFLGALKDFECWGPKVAPNGLILVDDADDPTLPDLLELIELLKTVRGVSWLSTIDGFAVFRRDETAPWDLLAHLRAMLAPRGIHRAWDMSALHSMRLPSNYGRSRTWSDGGLDTAYELCFLARCGPGAYGYSPRSSVDDRELLKALSSDRGDGAYIAADAESPMCRAILCHPDEALDSAPLLQPGGVLIARDTGGGDDAHTLAVHNDLIHAGLDGCGWFERTHWGVRLPHRLSGEAILELAIAARLEPDR
jgi:hypothetical protein